MFLVSAGSDGYIFLTARLLEYYYSYLVTQTWTNELLMDVSIY